MTTEEMKRTAAEAALAWVKPDTIIGVGTGSTANAFIEALAQIKGQIEGTVASSRASEALLKKHRIPVFDLNGVNEISVYVDGTDEVNDALQLIKGGGGAQTGEKVVAAVAKTFVCIADERKKVERLGQFPLAIEVLPMARSYVARQLVLLGGNPMYREHFTTDHGHIILDVHGLSMREPIKLEEQLNNITGIVAHGLFAKRPADVLLLGTQAGVIQK